MDVVVRGTPVAGGALTKGMTPSGGPAVEIAMHGSTSVRVIFTDWRVLRDLGRLMLDAAAEMRKESPG